jgi:hypothetical protein
MKLSDDEVLWISAILHKSKSKVLSEYPEAQLIMDKICNESGKIVANKARKLLKLGKWS